MQIYNAIESGAESGVGAILPAFKDGVANFSKAHNVIKTNFHNAVKRLANAKTQSEYTKIYNSLTQMHRQYLKSGDLLNKIKQYSANNDYRSIANELGNFVSSNNQNQIISDILQPDVRLQNNTDNAKALISNYNLDDKFKYALINNTSGISHNADFTDYGNGNIKINNLLNKNRPNAKEMANIFLAKPQNIPLSKEYSYIPKWNANIINIKYNLTGNKVIPQDWEGIVFNQDSSLSKNISNSIEMQNEIRNQFNIMRTDTFNDKLEVDFSQDSNLHLSIGHATILEPYIDSQGYFHGILFDKYDFDWFEFYKSLNYYNIIAYFANDYFRIIQLFKGHNYYILAPIIFKW